MKLPYEPASAEQQAAIDALTDEDIRSIDAAIMAGASRQWRKIARVAGRAMAATSETFKTIPDSFYIERIRRLVADGELESQGDISQWSICEVRLPQE